MWRYIFIYVKLSIESKNNFENPAWMRSPVPRN